MKHTELYQEYKRLDELERKELIAAVEAHGGEYVFIHLDDEGDYDDDERNNAPIISGSYGWMSNYEDFYVSRVEVIKGHLNLYGWQTEGYSDEREIDDVAHGHLGYVTDMIPETDDVKDVTTNTPQPILVVSPEDVENAGFKSNLTPDQFQQFVGLMKKAYEWNMDIYWDALRQACEHLELEPLNESEEDGEV